MKLQVTDKALYLDRRQFIGAAIGLAAAARLDAQPAVHGRRLENVQKSPLSTGEPPTLPAPFSAEGAQAFLDSPLIDQLTFFDVDSNSISRRLQAVTWFSFPRKTSRRTKVIPRSSRCFHTAPSITWVT